MKLLIQDFINRVLQDMGNSYATRYSNRWRPALFFKFDANLRYSYVDLLLNNGGVGAVAGSVAGEAKTEEFSGSKINFSFGSIAARSR